MSETSLVLIVFEIIVLLFSAILHEIAHGYEAERLGDDTARRAGRLTLNPLVHLDFFTSILMPILLIWATNGAFFFAAAKPVPYNPNNLKNPRSGSAKIALAGPLTNFLIALVFSIALRITVLFPVSDAFILFLSIIVYINIILGIFNLIPIRPSTGLVFCLRSCLQVKGRIRLCISSNAGASCWFYCSYFSVFNLSFRLYNSFSRSLPANRCRSEGQSNVYGLR